MTAQMFVDLLKLQHHPEGGYYKETYRASGIIKEECLPGVFNGERSYSTAIYFLLQQGDYSAFHRIKSDECWHFYEGGPLLVHMIDNRGNHSCVQLGRNLHKGEVFQFVVPANVWFASQPAPGTSFSLVGCTVSPGFDFADFEMANADELTAEFPAHHELINRLCRK